MRRILFGSIIILFFAAPSYAWADVFCPDGSAALGDNICNCSAQETTPISSNFIPNTQLGSNLGTGQNSFGGMSFTGIGGALASCANIGGSVIGAAGGLFGGSSGGNIVPTPSNAPQQNQSTTPTDEQMPGETTGAAAGGSAGGQSVPVGDKEAQKKIDAVKAEEQKANQREQCLNGVAYALAKNALQKLSDKTLNWVNTGFGGNPFYVRNIDSYLKSVSDEKISQYLDYLPQSDPVFGFALRSSIKQHITGESDGWLNKAMNTPEARKYQDFQDNFTNGGWGAFLNMNNNAVGAYFNATDSLSDAINTAKQNVRDELTQGDGFLSMKKCVEFKPSNAPKVNQSGTPLDEQLPDDEGVANPTSVPGGSSSSAKSTCLRYETVTPGKLISDQASTILNSKAVQLQLADKINETLGSFFDQLMDNLFSKGLSGSSGRGGTTYDPINSPGNNVIRSSDGSRTLSAANACQSPLGYDEVSGGFNGDFDISRPQQLRSILVTQKDFLNENLNSQKMMSNIIPTLGKLDYCIPGPNPLWRKELQNNFDSFIGSIKVVTVTDDPDLVSTVLNYADIGGMASNYYCKINQVGCSPSGRIIGYQTAGLSLFDKVDETSKRAPDIQISVNSDVNQVQGDKMSGFLTMMFNFVQNLYNNKYNSTVLADAFIAADREHPDLALGQLKDSLNETANLVSYNNNIAEYNQQYNTTIQNTEDAIKELESIYADELDIVTKAKARYIAANPSVNVACLNRAYVTPPIPDAITNSNAHPRRAANTSADVDISARAKAYFYSHL